MLLGYLMIQENTHDILSYATWYQFYFKNSICIRVCIYLYTHTHMYINVEKLCAKNLSELFRFSQMYFLSRAETKKWIDSSCDLKIRYDYSI